MTSRSLCETRDRTITDFPILECALRDRRMRAHRSLMFLEMSKTFKDLDIQFNLKRFEMVRRCSGTINVVPMKTSS